MARTAALLWTLGVWCATANAQSPTLVIEVETYGASRASTAPPPWTDAMRDWGTPPSTLRPMDPTTLDELVVEADAILVHVAAGEMEAAVVRADQWLERVAAAPEALGERLEAAKTTLDVCLYRARAYLSGGERTRAEDKVLRCRALVPRASPHEERHPPAVLQILAEVDEQLARDARSLVLRDLRRGCELRLQGQPAAPTRGALNRLAAGDYIVRERCADGERVVLASVPRAPRSRTEVWLDEPLHNVFRGPPVRLVYATPESAMRFAVLHAAIMADAIDAEDAFVLIPRPDGTVAVRQLRAGEVVAETTLEEGDYSARELTRALRRGEPGGDVDSDRDRRPAYVAASALVPLGLGAALGGAALRVEARLDADYCDAEGRCRPGFERLRTRGVRMGRASSAMVVAGASTGAAALVHWLIVRRRGGGETVQFVPDMRCDRTGCALGTSARF